MTLENEMPRRALFQCNGCGMEIHLLAPVERACPACGGTFKEITDDSDERNDIDLGYHPKNAPQATIFRKGRLQESEIDRIIEVSMPDVIEGFERLLKASSEEG